MKTLNPTRYAELLAQALPRVIRHDGELERSPHGCSLSTNARARPARNVSSPNFSRLSSASMNKSIMRYRRLRRARCWNFSCRSMVCREGFVAS